MISQNVTESMKNWEIGDCPTGISTHYECEGGMQTLVENTCQQLLEGQ